MSTMDNQYYYKLMASYLSKRNCDESFVRYFLGKGAKKSPEELERADERKRRLQRERSRRYRALKNARRQHEGREPEAGESRKARALLDDELSDTDEPPTLCDLTYDDKSDCASDDNSAQSAPELKPATASASAAASAGAGARPPLSLDQLLASPNAELDYPTVHSLMFHWLQT